VIFIFIFSFFGGSFSFLFPKLREFTDGIFFIEKILSQNGERFNTKKSVTCYCGCVFFWNFFCSRNGDHPYEDLAKYGDEPDIK
jgi:hypothetical protein